jgi:hypothetical protein
VSDCWCNIPADQTLSCLADLRRKRGAAQQPVVAVIGEGWSAGSLWSLSPAPRQSSFRRCLRLIRLQAVGSPENGTVGTELGLKAVGIGFPDEVLIPAYTCIAGALLVVKAVPRGGVSLLSFCWIVRAGEVNL